MMESIRNGCRSRSRQLVLCGVCLYCMASPAVAQTTTASTQPAASSDTPSQTGATNNSGLADIVVTAQRRAERLQDVPIAITALSGEALTEKGVQNSFDLAKVVPGLSLNTQLGGNAQPRIRGIGTAASGPGIENPVATYIDGVYYGAQVGGLLDLRDIEQVAVLKGPQGTLFGRNATGGLVQITTRGPSQTFTADASATIGTKETLGGDLFIAGGLSQDLAASVTLRVDNQYKGFGTNFIDGTSIRKRKSFATRDKLLFQPSADTKITLTGFYVEYHAPGVNSQYKVNNIVPPYPAGFGPFDAYLDVKSQLDVSQHGGNVTIQQDLGSVTAQSITSYSRTHFFTNIDGDQLPARNVTLDLRSAEQEISQEFQLTSKSGGPFSWVTGLYYYRSHSGYEPLVTNAYVASTTTTYRSMNKLDSFAGYGQGTYKLGEATNFTAGLRYTIDRRAIQTSSTVVNPAGTTVTTGAADHVFRKLTWRLSLDHHFTSEILGYASYNRGFKSGLYEPQSVIPLLLRPETLDAYEIGLKSDLFDRHVRLNVAGFYNDYDNVQVVQVVNNRQTIFNGNGLKSYGVDFDLTVSPVEGLTFSNGLSLFHGRYGSFDNAFISTPKAGGGDTVVFAPLPSGRKIQNAPDHTYNLGTTYSLPTSAGTFVFNSTYYRNSGYFTAPENRLFQHGYSLWDASVVWTAPSRKYDLRLVGRNLTNRVYAQQLNTSTTGDSISPAPGRIVTLTAGVHF